MLGIFRQASSRTTRTSRPRTFSACKKSSGRLHGEASQKGQICGRTTSLMMSRCQIPAALSRSTHLAARTPSQKCSAAEPTLSLSRARLFNKTSKSGNLNSTPNHHNRLLLKNNNNNFNNNNFPKLNLTRNYWTRNEPPKPLFTPIKRNSFFNEWRNPQFLTMPAYHSRDNYHRTHGMIVIPEYWGLNQSMKSFSDTIALHEFTTLIPDIFRKLPSHEQLASSFDQKSDRLSNYPQIDQLIQDIRASNYFLRHALNCEFVGLFGINHSAQVLYDILPHLSADEINAAVVVSGTPRSDSKFWSQDITIPTHFHFGRRNNQTFEFCNLKDALKVEKRANEMKNVENKIHFYPGAEQIFLYKDAFPETFSQIHTEWAWKNISEFLRATAAQKDEEMEKSGRKKMFLHLPQEEIDPKKKNYMPPAGKREPYYVQLSKHL